MHPWDTSGRGIQALASDAINASFTHTYVRVFFTWVYRYEGPQFFKLVLGFSEPATTVKFDTWLH